MPDTAPHTLLIVGNGLAAASLALSLPPTLPIALLCKHDLGSNASHHAQGGIAAVLATTDSLDHHVADTLSAGAGHGDPAAIQAILGEGKAAIDWLLHWGVPFNRQADGQLHLTREGGHDTRRIAHAADRTGAAIMQQLHQALRQRQRLDILEHCMALDIVRDGNGRCCGLEVLHHGRPRRLHARCVALASGGLGQIHPQTTTPPECTGDGIAMAWRAGCQVADLEFIQFHPTGLAIDTGGRTFLISEAVRGEGGILRNEAGERFMPRHHPLAELAPRDIVARAIAAEIARQQQPFVWLDISHRPAEAIRRHFPAIAHHCLAHGIDITRQPIPVRPVQHYTCGGVRTDVAGRTGIPGLYCLGEAACTGLHGANRLASNSLLECVVMGRNAARAILADEPWPPADTTAPDAPPIAGPVAAAISASTSDPISTPAPARPMPASPDSGHGAASASTPVPGSRATPPAGHRTIATATADIPPAGHDDTTPSRTEAIPPFSRQALQTLCAHSLGIIRNDHDLQRACRILDAWMARASCPPDQQQVSPQKRTASQQPPLAPQSPADHAGSDALADQTLPDTERLIRHHEDRNLLTCARLVAHAAAARRQNLGAHYNIDLAEPPPASAPRHQRTRSAVPSRSIADALAMPAETAETELDPPRVAIGLQAADLS